MNIHTNSYPDLINKTFELNNFICTVTKIDENHIYYDMQNKAKTFKQKDCKIGIDFLPKLIQQINCNNPNKIYVVEHKDDCAIVGSSHFVIVVAASSIEVAKSHVKEKIGIDVDPTWLMSAVYPTIYVSNGSVPESIQAIILYNGNCHF